MMTSTPTASERPESSLFSRIVAAWVDGARTLFGASPSRQPALDALRAASILLVLTQHWGPRLYMTGGQNAGWHTVFPFSMGFIGVDMFFVLSGFLIGRQLWKELEKEGTISYARFFVRRSFRIWPFYYFFLGVWCLYYPFDTGSARWSEVFFYANYTDERGIMGSWSLASEEQFYVLTPLILLAFRRRIPLWGYFVVIGGLEAASLAARYHEVSRMLAAGQKVEYFEQLHLHCDGLLAGLAMALASVLRPAWFERGKNAARGWAVFAAGCVLAGVLYKLHRKMFNLTSLAILFTALTYALLVSWDWVQKALTWRPFQVISMLSFGMYLNHFLLMTAGARWWNVLTKSWGLTPTVSFFAGFAAVTVLCTAGAVATYILLEHPFLVWRDAILKRWEQRPARVVAAAD